MALALCHGQPKSGSTFVFFTAVRLSQYVNGQNYWELLKELGVNDSFVPQPDASKLQDLLPKLNGRFLPLKTHCSLDPPIRKLITQGCVRAVTSFRDPRDVCLSYLDAGQHERDGGRQRHFFRFQTIEDVPPDIKTSCIQVQGWIDCPDVLAIPHYLSANAHDHMVRGLCRHFGHEAHWQAVAIDMQASKSDVPEFNKATSDRFLQDLTKEQIAYCQTRLLDELKQYQVNLDRVMATWGCSDLNQTLCNARDDALRQIGLTPQTSC